MVIAKCCKCNYSIIRKLFLPVLCVCLSLSLSDQQMMTRPVSAVGYRRPLSQHARMAMRMHPDPRYRVRLHQDKLDS